MMRVGYAPDVTAKLIALICLMTLKELIFLLLTAGRSMSKAEVCFLFELNTLISYLASNSCAEGIS